jgi:tetratricopeptide (TPR) repeat protein
MTAGKVKLALIYTIFPLAAAVSLAFLGPWVFLTSEHPFPSPDKIREVRQSAEGDALALSLGLRRLAADLWFIRLMQYYGTPELEWEPVPLLKKKDPSQTYGAGRYPDFLPMARHILALDPYFSNACLYAAGSLAFNISRPEEAISLLNIARIYNPKEWKFVTLLAAIGYSTAKNPEEVAKTITPLIMEPDCPVMLRQLAAFLNKKAGNYRAAYLIYKTILETTKDKFYLENAAKELAKLETVDGFKK